MYLYNDLAFYRNGDVTLYHYYKYIISNIITFLHFTTKPRLKDSLIIAAGRTVKLERNVSNVISGNNDDNVSIGTFERVWNSDRKPEIVASKSG